MGLPINIFLQLLFFAITICSISCRSQPNLKEKALDAPAPRSTGVLAALAPNSIFAVLQSISAHITTTVEIRSGPSIVTIEDEKRVARSTAGDFQLSVRRSHKGSETGDTEETFSAIKVGTRFFTKGTGGPFVLWDDALDEPEKMLLTVVGETWSMVSFFAPCLRERVSEDETILELAQPECELSTPPSSAPLRASAHNFFGRVRFQPGQPAKCDFMATLKVEASGNTATVTIRHVAELHSLSETEQILAPQDFISSRRERPLKMILSVLSGLRVQWGPGAPDILRSAISSPPSAP